MAKKKESETLSQRKQAQKEFLELKKMQSGEMAPPPKPSEVAIMPKNFREKMQNYWYHFRWRIVVIVSIVALMAVLICQCATKTKWDMNIVYFTYTPVLDEQTRLIADYFEGICEDINGDGKVNITVSNCSIPKDNSNVQYKNTILTKLQALISAEPNALLFITDSESISYFDAEALEGFFITDQIKLDEEFYNATESEAFGKLPEGLQIACRKVEGTFIEKHKDVEKVYKECTEILEKLEKK